MDAAIAKVVDAFISLGPGAVFCLPLIGWIYLQSRRNDELVNKLFEIATGASTATANSAAASNRLADMLAVRKPTE